MLEDQEPLLRRLIFIIQNCDLYISIGTRLPFMVTGYNSKDFARKAKKIMVDIDQLEVKKAMLILIKICSDAKYFLNKLYEYLPNRVGLTKDWTSYCKNVRHKYPIVLEKFKKEKRLLILMYLLTLYLMH